jgi:outer membrane protein assembly factor BamB
MFRRLDARTGKVRWETNVRRNAAKYFFHGDVFIAPDRIVASADVDTATGAEAGVHAFDRDSGRQLWKYPAGRGVWGAVIGSGRRVFTYTGTGELIALDLESGKRDWSNPLKASVWESPGVLAQKVFAASNDGSLYAFDSETGRVEWQQKLGAVVTTSVRATQDAVYAGTGDGVMHRLAATSGEMLSSLKLDAALKPSSVPMITRDAVLVLLVDGGANYRALVSLDMKLGRINWRRAAPDRWTTTRVFATDTTIVLGTSSGEVTSYCLADGSHAWSHKLSGAPIRSIGGTDETLYVGTPEGTLYAIRPPAPACDRKTA